MQPVGPSGLSRLWDGAVGYPYFSQHAADGTNGVNVDVEWLMELRTTELEVPVEWSISSGSLPPGISLVDLDPDDFLISLAGTPTEAGTFTFTVDVHGGGFLRASTEFMLRVKPPLIITNLAEFNTAIYDMIIAFEPFGMTTDGILLSIQSVADGEESVNNFTGFSFQDWGGAAWKDLELPGSPRIAGITLDQTTGGNIFGFFREGGGALETTWIKSGSDITPAGTYTKVGGPADLATVTLAEF